MTRDDLLRIAREADEYADERHRLNSRQFTDSRLNPTPDDPDFNVSKQELRDRRFATLVMKHIAEAKRTRRASENTQLYP